MAEITGPRDLTQRELQILELIADGCEAREVGARLGIVEGTVRAHLTRIRAALGGARNATHAVTIAWQRGILGGDRRLDRAPGPMPVRAADDTQ